MAEYIIRDQAKQAIYEYIVQQTVSKYPSEELCRASRMGAEGAMYEIDYVPAADVVEVVRCKYCKHGRKTNRIMSPEKFFKEDCVVCECEDVVGDELMIYVPTHFCSYGTPKERGGEK